MFCAGYYLTKIVEFIPLRNVKVWSFDSLILNYNFDIVKVFGMYWVMLWIVSGLKVVKVVNKIGWFEFEFDLNLSLKVFEMYTDLWIQLGCRL